jgi:hypothetical protein
MATEAVILKYIADLAAKDKEIELLKADLECLKEASLITIRQYEEKLQAIRSQEPLAWINKQPPYSDAIEYYKSDYATEHIPLFAHPVIKEVKE